MTDEGVFDGPAVLAVAAQSHDVRVRLAGYLDPIDGHYHWQGTVFGQLSAEAAKCNGDATLTIDGRTAPARLVEATPWGTHMIAGVGAPPYALDECGLPVSHHA